MQILVISQYFWPENFRINDIVQEFVQRGHDVTVLTGVPNYPMGVVFAEFREHAERFTNFQGAEIVRVPLLPRGNGGLRLFINYISFFLAASTIGLWKVRKRRFDVVFVFEPSPITVGIPAIIYRKISRTPVIFWVLDLWPETLSAIGVIRSPTLLAIVGKLVRIIYNRCDFVLGQSKGFLENIAKYCDNKEKIRYFPNWAESIYQKGSVTPAPEVRIQNNIFNVMFAGNIGEAQDFPTILAAAELLKADEQIRWLIVGDGRMSNWLKAEVVRRGLQKSFILLGRFSEDRMPSFFIHADALLVSLKADPVFSLTIPGKVQSYLMAGIPIIGVLDGEGMQVIKEANAGIVCPSGDSQALADAVREMAKMPKSERENWGRQGRLYAEREFGKDMIMDRLESWMAELVFQRSIDRGAT